MNRRILILATAVQSQLVFNVWVGIGLLLLMMILAGCSSVNRIGVGLGASVQAELLPQTMPTTDSPTLPVPMMEEGADANVAALLAQAEALADDDELAAALALADEAASMDPTNARAHSMRGRILYSLGDFDAALTAFDVAIHLGMDWPEGYLLLSNIYNTMGNTVAELAALDRTIDLSLAQQDGSADSVLTLALQYRSELRAKTGDLPGAIADLETSLSIAPWKYGNFKTLSDMRYRLAAHQTAFPADPTVLLADLNERLAADPNDVQALLDRGFLILQLAFIDDDASNLNAAYQDFTLALTIDPALAEAYHGRALTTWMVTRSAGVSEIDIEEMLALAENISTLNFQTADADVTIADGRVTMTNTVTGAVTVQSIDEWRMAYAETPGVEGATPDVALADLETALSLAPDLVAARHDRGVMRLRAWFEDGLMSMMMDGPPASVDEILAAAVADLDFAAEQSPDWAAARFNRGLVRLFQGVSLMGVYMASDGDDEIIDAMQSSFEATITDATWLIDHDASPGWAHFMRLLAISFLQDLVSEMDPTLAAYMETDTQRMYERVPDFNTDNAILQFADQVRLSLQIAPPPLVTTGALAFSGEDLFYTNADYGLRLKTPVYVADSNYAAAAANGTLWLHMADGFRVFDVLVMQPTLGDQSVEMWLDNTLLSLMPPGKLVEQTPLQTQYGRATLFSYQGGIEAVTAILPIGDYLFSFEYSPGPYEGEYPTTRLGFETRPLDVVLAEFIYGLTVDGVVGDQPLDPRVGPMVARSIRDQGWDAMQSGDYEEAVRLLRLTIEYTPDDAVALNNLAWTLAYNLQTELDAALDYALRAVALDPKPSYYDTLGMVYYQMQRYDEALAAYTEALTQNPDLAASLLGRADVYIELDEFEKAIQDLEHYLDVEPSAEDADDIHARIEALRTR
jgi:tetratricopeptide (TPR) repeat protein